LRQSYIAALQVTDRPFRQRGGDSGPLAVRVDRLQAFVAKQQNPLSDSTTWALLETCGGKCFCQPFVRLPRIGDKAKRDTFPAFITRRTSRSPAAA